MSHTIKFKLDYIADFVDELAPKMVEAGAKVVEPVLKANTQAAGGKSVRITGKRTGSIQFIPRSTGFMFRSIRASHPVIDKTKAKYRTYVYFDGERRNGSGIKRNNEIAAYLEYGAPKKFNRSQEAMGFIKKTVSKTRKTVESAMVQIVEDYFRTENT